jgi:hypothetical protein
MRRKVSPVWIHSNTHNRRRFFDLSLSDTGTHRCTCPGLYQWRDRDADQGKASAPGRSPGPQRPCARSQVRFLCGPRASLPAGPALRVPSRPRRSGKPIVPSRSSWPPVPYRPRPPLSWVDTAINENQGPIRECTPMDATRARRTKDRARQTWYALHRQRRFARFLGFAKPGEATARINPGRC